MNVALNRKRSRLALDDDDDHRPEPAPAFVDALKRTKTQSELDELDIVAPEEAWSIDVSSILSSPTLANAPNSSLQAHNNLSNYAVGSSVLVFCVQGNLHLHYDLLW